MVLSFVQFLVRAFLLHYYMVESVTQQHRANMPERAVFYNSNNNPLLYEVIDPLMRAELSLSDHLTKGPDSQYHCVGKQISRT
jgi:hypothetical protein